MKKVLIPLASILLIVFSLIYINAGGFEEVEIIQKTSKKKYIIGRFFEGNVKSEKFSNLFLEIEELKKTQNYKGHLGAIYFNNPEKSKGNIEAFLGVISEENINNIPADFEKEEITEGKVIQGKVKASNIFGISISKVYNAIFKFADEKKLTLDEYYIEWFPSKDEVVVQIRIKNE